VRVERAEELADASLALPGDSLLLIEYLDARGPDGMARKYRVMVIDGVIYPLHLAISADWKVHYFTAGMAENADWRAEEQRFLEDMPSVLGANAMAALTKVGETLGLDYMGIDFALNKDKSILLFETNATMVIVTPSPEPMWDYRRAAVARALRAAQDLLRGRLAGTGVHKPL
jgi:glutathione synthase/RimK-type ligase-like ATP-grasp enzyme